MRRLLAISVVILLVGAITIPVFATTQDVIPPTPLVCSDGSISWQPLADLSVLVDNNLRLQHLLSVKRPGINTGISLPAGTYNLVVKTWDGYSTEEYTRLDHADQPNERVQVNFAVDDNKGGASDVTSDLADGVLWADATTNLGVIGLPLGAQAVSIVGVGDSVVPVGLCLTAVVEPEPPTTTTTPPETTTTTVLPETTTTTVPPETTTTTAVLSTTTTAAPPKILPFTGSSTAGAGGMAVGLILLGGLALLIGSTRGRRGKREV